MDKEDFKRTTFDTTGDKAASIGILVIRVLVCGMLFRCHGWEKLVGYNLMVHGFHNPLHLGSHISLAYAMLADGICSVLIALGLFTRPAALIVVVNFLVIFALIHPGSELVWNYGAVFLGILISGPGRFSLDARFFRTAKG